ncbi:unnamed protein product [Adineta steineri]|uniref:AMP-dependent synthetase/ligase domain-containing protein n=1 Tax=Adineta steineri TaxID=433720 RepID=A0A814BNK0_9BILA|nr:unnamed protein product [Adineta steineri]CAF3643982.1 unnamed protein product [Adineta steineri]
MNTQNRTVLDKRQALIDPDSLLSIIMTSGSTGIPETAVITNFGALNITINIWNWYGHYSSRFCAYSPMYYMASSIIGNTLIAISKCAIIIPHFEYDIVAIMRTIDEEKCTWMLGTPHLFRNILQHSDRDKYDLSSLQSVAIGSTIEEPELVRKIEVELRIK